MDLKQLELFVAVTEKGSFSRAAVSLNLSQPTLSRHVGALERELGQRLLERTGRGVGLTAAGQAFLVHAKVMLGAAGQALFEMKEMRSDPTGTVVIGLPHRVSVGLCVPLVQRFRQSLPNAMVSLIEGLSLSLREGLISGRIDVGVLFDPAPTPLLRYEPLLRERLVLMAPRGARLPALVGLQALREFPMVLPATPNPIRSLVDAVLLPRRIALDIVAEVGAVHSAVALVEHGVACSILPESALMACQDPGRVVCAPIGPPTMWNRLVLALPASRPISRLTLEAAKLLRQLDFRTAS
jgi:LysR family transcriptional regulator, nitrogen assimilation regulatory protein